MNSSTTTRGLGEALRQALDSIVEDWETRAASAGISSASRAELRATLAALAHEAAETLNGTAASRPAPALAADDLRLDGWLQGQALFVSSAIEQTARSLGRDLTAAEAQSIQAAIEAVARRQTVQLVERRERGLRLSCETQSRCLSFLSHDLRGNLNGVVLMTEVLRRELSQHPQFAESVNDLGLIRSSVMETVAAMERMVTAERLARGKVSAHIGRTTLDAIGREVLEHARKPAQDKNIELDVDLPKAPVHTDAELVSLAISSFVENAIRHARGPVRISAKPCQDGACSIAVSDAGPGIDAPRLRELVEGYGATDAQGRARRGLGLLIARHVAELLNGHVSAESSPEGSVFRLNFPDAK